MKTADITSAAILIALAILVAAGTLDLPYWSEFSPGPAFAARWTALVGGILGALLLWEALTRAQHDPVEWPDREGMRRVALAMGLIWTFFIALPWLGFAASASLFMLAMLLMVLRRQPWPAFAATVITVAATYGIFIAWLQIKLPQGPFGL